MDYLKIGYIKKTHGLKGELSVLPLTDNPKRFKKLKSFYVSIDNQYKAFDLEYAGITPKEVIVKPVGYNSIGEVQCFINKYIEIDRSLGVNLEEWEYYTQDLIGCQLVYEDKPVGEVIDILNSGANDNMLVKTSDDREIYYPFVRDFITNVDIVNKRICINQTEDFFDITDS